MVGLGMGQTATALDKMLDPFSLCLDAESSMRVSRFRVDKSVQERVDNLAELANDGLLNDDERTEYESLINVSDLISILKLKAKQRLQADLG